MPNSQLFSVIKQISPETKTVVMVLLVFCQMFLLSACSSQEDKWRVSLQQQALVSDTKLKRLKNHIKSGNVANTRILNHYADIISQNKPEMSMISDALAEDASNQGPIIRSLESRLSDANSDIPLALSGGYDAVNKVFQELSTIEIAANPDTYNMMLTDPINVLADMSDGKLARVAALSKEASARMNSADNFGAGSQLIGNPQYGSWNSNSSGGSFWQWYGQYAFFSSLINRPVYYSNWGRNRDYSYYNDYGRSAYTSPSQRQGQESVQRRTKERFNRSGKKFNSPYAQAKQTTSTVARKQAKFRPKSVARSAPKTTTSNYRSSSYQSSRSSFGGK